MRFAALFTAASLASGALATPLTLSLDPFSLLGVDFSASNHFGAPVAPWNQGAKPGWYSGSSPHLYPELPCLSGLICRILKFFPFLLQCPTPPPSDGYHQTFSNLTGATQASDYLTYGLVDTVDECKAMCNSVSGCTFVNSYHDVNGKGGSTQLTCSLFSSCHTSADADNIGGQTQPDGTIDYITNSDGYCKNS